MIGSYPIVMKAPHLASALFCLTFTGMSFGEAPKAPIVGSPEYERLVNVIKPAKSELNWLKIDWGTDLWEARKQAAEQGKPIFLWEMDGHPMGCT